MHMNNLHLSPEAQNDLEEIRDYIATELENPIAALNTVSRITKRASVFCKPTPGRVHRFPLLPM